jgi:dTDP-4-amino-4,6-dideoxygalactose transaminase
MIKNYYLENKFQMSSAPIKYDLQIKYGNEYGIEEEKAVLQVLRQNAPTSGEACLRFEQAFAEYCGTRYARVVSNGTAALFLSMIGLEIGPGDRVVTTPLTWIATAAAPMTLGAEIDFVDIDPITYNLDANLIEEQLTSKTKAVIPIHLYGQCCDMDPILKLSKKYGFAVVEDACHAVGGEYKGKKAGSMGISGCFSFHEQKNISTLGEGGMITTNDSELFERISLYRSHCTRVYGQSTKYCSLDETQFPMDKKFWWQDFDDVGYNFRMTDIQAVVGIEQLKKLDMLNQRRINNANYLINGLKEVRGLILPKVLSENKHVFHLFPVMIEPEKFGMNKEDFIYLMLKKFGIKVGFHYIPLHWTSAFNKRGYRRGQFPHADRVGEQVVTLPLHPRQTHAALDYLIECILKLKN